MAIKSELTQSPVQHSFPALYQGAPSGQIVLFSSLSEGTVVKKGSISSSNEVGTFCSAWVECTDKHHWTRLSTGDGVCITQED